MYIQTFFIALLLLFLVSCAPTFNLLDPRFNASGEGDKTIVGSIEERSNELFIASPVTRVDERTVLVDGPEGRTTWKVEHGIRVRRAGERTLVHDADSDWRLSPGAPAGALVSHDEGDGRAFVRCTFTGTPPDTDGDGIPGPVDLCEIDLGDTTSFPEDELRFWIKSSVATRQGDLQIVLYTDKTDPPTGKRLVSKYEMVIPALDPADDWTKVFAKIEDRDGNAHKLKDEIGIPRFMTLRCLKDCDGLEIYMDDFWLVKDLIAQVGAIQTAPDGRTTFVLNRAAGDTVSNEVVYHDDTVALTNWVEMANRPGGANLFAPAGVYYVSIVGLPSVGGSYSLPLYNYTQIRGADQNKTTFKNTGRSATGPGIMFRSAAPAPVKIKIKNCGFDWNGWNLEDFRSVIAISPHTMPEASAQNIHIHHNRFFDSDLPGMQGCDFGQDACATRQRHHIVVQKVDGLWIEHNQMSGGGRIKTGGAGLGRNMHIRHNTLDFVNDDGITIADFIAGVTEHVEITDNTITNPVTSGIFFGADGEPFTTVPDMVLRDVAIARNRISGFFRNAGILGLLPLTAENVQIHNNFIENTRATEIRPKVHQSVSGIKLGRDDAATGPPATDIRVERNTVVASGIHATFPNGGAGMSFRGPISDLNITNNEVRCAGCDSVDHGIWLMRGAFDNVELRDNTVDGAKTALNIGHSPSPRTITVTNTRILRNSFLNSISEGSGQISITVYPGETIEARIAGNHIYRGAGYGILCSGTGTLRLTDILMNDFSDNRVDIEGCR